VASAHAELSMIHQVWIGVSDHQISELPWITKYNLAHLKRMQTVQMRTFIGILQLNFDVTSAGHRRCLPFARTGSHAEEAGCWGFHIYHICIIYYIEWLIRKVQTNLLSGLLGFVSMDMAEPLSWACIVSSPNTVHQNEDERSHLYEWNMQSSDLTTINLPDDLDKERECGSNSHEFITNIGDKHKQILLSRRVRMV
jgi:hypothetical protein